MRYPLFILLSTSLYVTSHARTFTDVQGRRMEAEVVSSSGSNVTIRRTDGKTYTLPITTFTTEDQAYLHAWKPETGTGKLPVSKEAGAGGSGNAEGLIAALGGTFDIATGVAIIKSNKDITPANLADLAATGQIRKLTLDGCKLGSEGVVELAKFKGLTGINLTHTMVNKVPDLKVLAGATTLEEIDLGGSDFGDEGLAVLCELKELKSLQLGHVGRSDKTAMTAEGLKVMQKLPKLELLVLHLQKLDEAMIPVLAELKTVKDFKVGGVTKDFLAKLQKAMPGAKVSSRGPTID